MENDGLKIIQMLMTRLDCSHQAGGGDGKRSKAFKACT